MTRPQSGWMQHDAESEQFIASLPASQHLCLVTRGVLLSKLCIPARSTEASFRWQLQPSADIPDGSTFYIDGSAVDADTKQLVRLGFAIVLVSPQGELLALGCGCPPAWIVDSGGAEA